MCGCAGANKGEMDEEKNKKEMDEGTKDVTAFLEMVIKS